MFVVDLLFEFAAGKGELGGIGDDDVVTAVCMREVEWLVFAHESDCDAGGHAAHRPIGSIHMMPEPCIRETRLTLESLLDKGTRALTADI